MIADELPIVAALLRRQRQAALGTLAAGAPFVSLVAFAAEPDFGGLLLHLSRLAPHTRQLLDDPRASLLVCEPDDGREDVQTLARLTLTGRASPLARDTPAFADGRALYLAKLPSSAALFDFADFELFRLVPERARYVGGFGRIYDLTVEHLRMASSSQ
ncbi:MAG TPA: pyridoxamine 5'-phosphate oxidase family protein [Roseiflexaceae bacterium]|nr:pyridoxamine 5'-phosphate oxidase family protein [Roseiflexaceae bacterium]